MKKATRKRKPTEKISDQIQKDLAASALRKKNTGEKPTARETTALRNIEKEREESLRWQYYESIPKKHWVEMSGRAHKILDDQADKFRLPLRGKTISLPKLAKAFHDFFATNKFAITAAEKETDPLMLGSDDSPGLERYRLAKARHAELDLEERQGQLISVEVFRQLALRFSGVYMRLGEELNRKHSNGTAEAFAEAQNECRRIVNECGDDTG